VQRQATARVCWSLTGLSLLFAVFLISTPVLGSSSPKKRSKSDRDIGAIGHRKIAYEATNWISLENEKKMGEQSSITFEQSNRLLFDPTIADYVERVAHTVAQNSDARIPITIRIIDSEEVDERILPGGYLYLSRGLLLRVGNECELASVLARGIAHSALRSGINLLIVARLGSPSANFGRELTNGPKFREGTAQRQADALRVKREEEFDADYFGLQYLYKSGYDPECFISYVEKAWSADASTTQVAPALSAFPPLPERLEALQKEITDILPKRDGAATNTPEFAGFRGQLTKLSSPKSTTTSESKAAPDQTTPNSQSTEASSEQNSSAPERAAGSPSRCADIASADPQFAMLAKTCDFAVSPRNLPNFICRETVKRFNGNAKRAGWKNLDVVTAEVRFERSTGTDRYFNVNIDGRPITGNTDLSSKDLGDYLVLFHPGGMWGYGEFGVDLSSVFASSSRTSFKFRDGVDPSLPSAAVFDFHIEKANSKFLLNVGNLHARSGIDGSLWIDSHNSKLLRMDFNTIDIEQNFPIKDFSGRISFGDVNIADAGHFLLPVASETVECQRNSNRCYRNVLEFRDCRKFGSESHIILK
jgi:beta-barrel assembly-enhancing protease